MTFSATAIIKNDTFDDSRTPEQQKLDELFQLKQRLEKKIDNQVPVTEFGFGNQNSEMRPSSRVSGFLLPGSTVSSSGNSNVSGRNLFVDSVFIAPTDFKGLAADMLSLMNFSYFIRLRRIVLTSITPSIPSFSFPVYLQIVSALTNNLVSLQENIDYRPLFTVKMGNLIYNQGNNEITYQPEVQAGKVSWLRGSDLQGINWSSNQPIIPETDRQDLITKGLVLAYYAAYDFQGLSQQQRNFLSDNFFAAFFNISMSIAIKGFNFTR